MATVRPLLDTTLEMTYYRLCTPKAMTHTESKIYSSLDLVRMVVVSRFIDQVTLLKRQVAGLPPSPLPLYISYSDSGAVAS